MCVELKRWGRVCALAGSFALCTLGALAQQPTAQQIQAFQNLSPEQQQAILQKFGISTGGGGSAGNSAAGSLRNQQGTAVSGAPAPDASGGNGTGLGGLDSLALQEPRFLPGDSLILEPTAKAPGAPASPGVGSGGSGGSGTAAGAGSGAAAGTSAASAPAAAGSNASSAASAAALSGSAMERTIAAQRKLDEYLLQLQRGNPQRLDATGVLNLPQGISIPLGGLTEKEATLRLNTEPRLSDFSFVVTRLPVNQPLLPFGYDLFRSGANALAAPQDGPVPANYVLGTGDVLNLQLIGENGGQYALEVGRDGTISFPDSGPLTVAGLRFPEAQALIEKRVREQRIGLTASVQMGPLRTISVFVLGEAEHPGSYTVSGLGTITTALYAAGGIKDTGSLRRVELRRNGTLVRRLDLYELLLDGDNSGDVRLLPGDVVFIPTLGPTASVSGEVRRPAIYEVTEQTVASELLFLAGGLMPDGDPRTAWLERIDDRRERTVVNLDLSQPAGRGLLLHDGDALHLTTIRDAEENSVRLLGHVYRPRALQWHANLRLTELVGSLGELQPLSDTHYLLIRRESGADRHIEMISADLAAAFAAPGTAADPLLQARDAVTVFDIAGSREWYMQPLFEQLQKQSTADNPLPVVTIDGSVKVSGRYPLEPGMKLSDLLRAGGGYGDSAYREQGELTRYTVVNGERRQTEVLSVDLRQLAPGSANDVPLKAFDRLLIKRVPDWLDQETVTLSGEVRFPGIYPIRKGETLRSVIERAGGLTPQAFAEGSVFTRKDLQQREQQQLQNLADRLQSELASLSLQQAQTTQGAVGGPEAVSAGQSLLTELKGTKAVGRLVIDLPAVMKNPKGGAQDIVLRDGDLLQIPSQTQEVTVIGEVQNATSHLYSAGNSRDDYLQLSGGLTQRADRKRIYVVRANGSVGVARHGWLGFGSTTTIAPGDTIVVPLDAERMRPLPMWQAVTQIVYNIAIAAAALHSF